MSTVGSETGERRAEGTRPEKAPASQPGPEARGDAQNEKSIAASLESAARLVIDFASSFFATVWGLLFRPAKVIPDAKPQGGSRFVTPVAFLMSNCLLFGLAVHFLLTGPFQFEAGEFFKTLADTVSPDLSVAVVLLRTIPAGIVTLMVSYMLVRLLLRQKTSCLARATVLSYAVSFQFLSVFLLVMVKGILDLVFIRKVGPRSFATPGGHEKVLYASLFLITMGVLAVGCIGVAANTARLVVRTGRPDWSATRRIVAGIFIAVTMLAVFIPNFAIVAAPDFLAGLPGRQPVPLGVTVLNHQITRNPGEGGFAIQMRVYFENHCEQPISIIETGDKELSGFLLEWPLVQTMRPNAYSPSSVALTIADSPSGKAPYLDIPAASKSWVELSGKMSDSEYQSLVQAVQNSQAAQHIKLRVLFLRGYSMGKPSEGASARFIPNVLPSSVPFQPTGTTESQDPTRKRRVR